MASHDNSLALACLIAALDESGQSRKACAIDCGLSEQEMSKALSVNRFDLRWLGCAAAVRRARVPRALHAREVRRRAAPACTSCGWPSPPPGGSPVAEMTRDEMIAKLELALSQALLGRGVLLAQTQRNYRINTADAMRLHALRDACFDAIAVIAALATPSTIEAKTDHDCRNPRTCCSTCWRR